jgi:hypothetical protein
MIYLDKFLNEMKNENKVLDALKSQGKCKNQPDDKYDPIELEIGIQVEYEHVDNREASKEIAKDHLEENPHYYTQVLAPKEDEVMEKALKVLKKNGYKSIESYMAKNENKDIKPHTTSKPFMRGAVIDFLKKHKNPTDSELHSWAKGMKFDIHKVEEIVYQLASEYVRENM